MLQCVTAQLNYNTIVPNIMQYIMEILFVKDFKQIHIFYNKKQKCVQHHYEVHILQIVGQIRLRL